MKLSEIRSVRATLSKDGPLDFLRVNHLHSVRELATCTVPTERNSLWVTVQFWQLASIERLTSLVWFVLRIQTDKNEKNYECCNDNLFNLNHLKNNY